ncbi:putative reverse transcriptase domain-containing protein, partial [Tanacetum coccineum]
MSSVNHDDFAYLKIPLENILFATNNFDDKNFRGEGGFGNHYIGQLLLSGELIDIHAQRWNKEWDEKEQQFWMEIFMLSSLKHKNLVSLVGFCDEKIIIYKYDSSASLDYRLSDSMLLTWVRRLEICVGVAHALSYIHYDEQRDFSIIHQNIERSDNMSGYIVGISIGSNKETETNITEGLVLDVELLDRVFKVPITTVKCIPHGYRLAFSEALKTVLYKVCRPKNRQERRSGNRKSLQQSSILESLATRGNDYDITTLVKIVLDGSRSRSLGQGGGDILEERTSEIDSVFGCIKSFPKGTSCGRDGLRAQHILDALCGEGYATSSDLLKSITSVINLWLARRYPPILVEFVASAPLTPLLKPDNMIRPIAVDTIWRRLVSKVAMKGVGKEMVVSGYHYDGSIAMLTVDFSNAFNLVDTSALPYEVRV